MRSQILICWTCNWWLIVSWSYLVLAGGLNSPLSLSKCCYLLALNVSWFIFDRPRHLVVPRSWSIHFSWKKMVLASDVAIESGAKCVLRTWWDSLDSVQAWTHLIFGKGLLRNCTFEHVHLLFFFDFDLQSKKFD
jgi:hypothetical protein